MAHSKRSEPPTSFRRWLGEKPATESSLHAYLASLGEWWNSEFKAATAEIDFGLRKTVSAIANRRGGEVFLGVNDDRSFAGTEVHEQRLEQILRQERATAGDWYLVDLNQSVTRVIPIGLANQPGKRVFILEVSPPGVPTFVLEGRNELSFFIRQGESSVRAGSFRAIEWYRGVNREELLRNLYLELRTLSRTIGAIYLGLAVNLGLTVPYLTRRLEDGSLYRFLTDDDLIFLLGRSRAPNQYEGGIYQDLFEAKYEIAKEMGMGMERHEIDEAIDDILSRAGEGLRNRADSFRDYLNKHGIPVD